MSVYKVERRVDTVIVEMDISVATQLVEILNIIQDNTRKAQSYQGSDIRELQQRLIEEGGVRDNSLLYRAETYHGYVEFKDGI